jgi:hypothetical protein
MMQLNSAPPAKINAGVFPNYDPEVKKTVPVSFKRSLIATAFAERSLFFHSLDKYRLRGARSSL